MNRADKQLARVMMERFLDGTLFDDILIDAAERDAGLSPTEVERSLEGSVLTDLLEDVDPNDPTWEELMAMLRADETADDLQEVAVRIEARVVLMKP